MTSIRNHSPLSLVALAAALTMGCNGKPAPSAPQPSNPESATEQAAPTAEKRQPAAMNAHAVLVRGALQGKTATGPWQTIAAGASMEQVSAVRALGKGARIDMTDAMGAARPTLWLRGGATAHLWQTEDDGVLVQLLAGQARVLGSERPTYLERGDARVDITDGDVIAARRDAGARVLFAHTRKAPERATWSVDLAGDIEPAGLGTIEVAGADAGADHHAYLELRRVHVEVESAGDYAYTSVEHIFYNASDAQLEGTFRFPLPENAMPLGLAMEINGRLMEGELVEREKARKTYESIVDEMQDPALLEWQQGNRFKLRVFPIEANSEKRVILRYAAPLSPSLGGHEYVYSTAAPDMQRTLDRFRLRFDGRTVIDREQFAAGEDVIVPLPTTEVPSVMQQVIAAPTGEPTDAIGAARARTAGVYTALHVTPDWSQLNLDASDETSAPATTLLAIVDTSRSALEGRALALKTLKLVLGELGPDDRFALMTSDITTQLANPQPVASDENTVASALAFVSAIEPDGASDIGAAFDHAAKLVTEWRTQGVGAVEILYIGDGTPTWGATEADPLRAQLDASLPGVPVHAAILGKGASSKLWQQITAGHSGRVARPRTLTHARRFAFTVARSASAPRIDDVRVTGLQSGTALPNQARTLYRGDALLAVLRSPADAAPAAVNLEGTYRGQPFKQTVRIIKPAATPLLAQRWASLHIDTLQASKAEKQTIVEVSRDFGVMSKHTSLLVLESEEAYKQHGIERRRALAQNAAGPRVTGGDLESLGERQASLSPDHIQPGDPEIRIPAPNDARSVVVVFPFGDTKLAHFDGDANAWIARFLIDKDTPDGKYTVLVNITHADGRVESLRLPYYVDTTAPQVDLTFKRRGNKGFTVTAKQTITQAEMLSMGRAGQPIPTGKKARILSDATRVELFLPDGKVLSLARKHEGHFRRRWRLAQKLTEPVVLQVVVTDDAHNQSTFAVRVSADGSHQVVPADAADDPASPEPTR